MATVANVLRSFFLVDLIKGLLVTLKHTPQPAFTFQYPAERRPVAPRFRGVLRLQVEPETGAVVPPYPFDSGLVGDKDSRIRAAPIKVGDSIVVATENGRVISVKDGQVRWSWPGGTPEAGILTTPVLSGETLYVILQNGQVQALNAENGGQGWVFTPPQAQ